ncbi:MAG: TonB-dependent receptor [Chitinophagales bacterium]
MNTKHIRLLIFFLCFFSFKAFAQNELTGHVYDNIHNTSVPYANIYIEDLRIGTVCDSDGIFSLKSLPQGTYVVSVYALGYQAKAQTVRIAGTTLHDFRMAVSFVEEQEVVVTGTASAAKSQNTSQPVTEVPNSYLKQNASTNIIDAISKVPGVSGITDGQSISKPVIRGLGYNRVVVVNDGVRQEGQQWGDEFGIEVDPNAVDRIEILKGPASLVYGSDALSGVINFLPEKTLPEGSIKGDVNFGYQTNNGLVNNVAHLAGSLRGGVMFSARVDNTMAHAYQNATDGYVFNTQFSNFNTDETIGMHRRWGFTQLHFSYFELRTGIADGAKDSAGNFVKQALDGNGNAISLPATNQELRSYTPFVINQLVKHQKLVWDNSIRVGGGRITGAFAWQNNSRQENNDITIANTSNIWYLMNTYNYDLRYISPTWNRFNFTVGANGMYQNSQNKGALLLIPEYNLFDIGGFAIANYWIERFDFSAGVRYDSRSFTGHDNYIDSNGNELSAGNPNAIHRFIGYTSNFNGMSASAGATYHPSENVYIKGNVARGFRAPNVAETGSNGIHDGTVVYEIGQPNLKPEQSMEVDITPGFRSRDVNAEVSVFYNSISNFIYAKQIPDSFNSSTPGFENAPVFLYTQTDAVLRGGEAMVDVHPARWPWFDWYTGYSIVDARLSNVPDSLNVIPFTPPAHLRSEFTYMFKKINRRFHNSYIRFGMNYTFEQSRPYQISSVYYGLGKMDPAPAYLLLNAAIGTDIMGHGKKVCSIYLNVDNIADVSYIDYMSRYRYIVNEVAGRPVNYVYNMGRNVSIKVFVPLDFKGR